MILKQIITNGVFKIGVQIITLLTTIIIARFLGSKILGEFNFASSLIAIVNVFFINSISSANIFLLNKKALSKSNALSSFFILSVVVLLLYGIVVLFYSYYKYYDTNINLFLTIVFLMLSEFIGVIFMASNSYYTANLNQYKASLPDSLRIVICKVLQIGFVYWFSDLLSLAIGVILATIFMTPILIKFFWPKVRLSLPSKEIIIMYAKTTINFMSFTLTKIVPQQLDKIILEYLVLFSFIGYYSIGQKIGNAIEMIAMSAGVVLFPFFTKLAENKDQQKAKYILKKFIIIFFNFIVIPLFVICFFSKDLLKIVFGSEFVISTITMQSYVLIGMLTIFMMPFNTLCIGFGKIKYINRVNIFSFVVFLIGAGFLFFNRDYNTDEKLINMMAVIRLVPNIVLIVFFLKYSSELLNSKYVKYFFLFSIQVLFFVTFSILNEYLTSNIFIIILLFIICHYTLNIIFKLNPVKHLKFFN